MSDRCFHALARVVRCSALVRALRIREYLFRALFAGNLGAGPGGAGALRFDFVDLLGQQCLSFFGCLLPPVGVLFPYVPSGGPRRVAEFPLLSAFPREQDSSMCAHACSRHGVGALHLQGCIMCLAPRLRSSSKAGIAVLSKGGAGAPC